MCNKFIKSFVEIVERNAINMLQFGLMSESKENNNDRNNNKTKDTRKRIEEKKKKIRRQKVTN